MECFKNRRVALVRALRLGRNHDEVIADIERRIAEWTHVPIENGEGIQVLRYQVGQKYEPHMDAFSDAFNTEESKGGQRVATVLMYLSDVVRGEERDKGSGGGAVVDARTL